MSDWLNSAGACIDAAMDTISAAQEMPDPGETAAVYASCAQAYALISIGVSLEKLTRSTTVVIETGPTTARREDQRARVIAHEIAQLVRKTGR